MKLALRKLPGGVIGLASQPTISRWENAPTMRELVRLTGAFVDTYCASYDTLYCSRDQAENLTKLHEAKLKSDRTCCRLANANQMRLILHTAAYWLMWKLRRAARVTALKNAEFAIVRLRLVKVAARVVETASCVCMALASACPDVDIFQHIAGALKPAAS